MKPLVSIILPIYNETIEWLEEAVNSILLQSYHHLEVILLLDNPDNEVLKDYLLNLSDDRIKLVINEVNLGLTKTLNTALKLVQGEYIIRMDADDISAKLRVEKQLSYLISNNLDLIGTSYDTINESGESLNASPKLVTQHDEIVKMLVFEQPIAHPTWLGKTEVFQALQYHEITGAEDYDFLCRAALSGYKLGNHPEKLLDYRIRMTSITSQLRYKQLINKYIISKSYEKSIRLKQAYVFTSSQYIEMEKFKKTYDTYERGKAILKISYFKASLKLMGSLLFMPYSKYFRFKIYCRVFANKLYKDQRSRL